MLQPSQCCAVDKSGAIEKKKKKISSVLRSMSDRPTSPLPDEDVAPPAQPAVGDLMDIHTDFFSPQEIAIAARLLPTAGSPAHSRNTSREMHVPDWTSSPAHSRNTSHELPAVIPPDMVANYIANPYLAGFVTVPHRSSLPSPTAPAAPATPPTASLAIAHDTDGAVDVTVESMCTQLRSCFIATKGMLSRNPSKLFVPWQVRGALCFSRLYQLLI
jgi:hypothetical protein